MRLKVYKEINNSSDDFESNILLEFLCDIKLDNASEIFEYCMNLTNEEYSYDECEYANISRVYINRFKDSLEWFKSRIDYRRNNPTLYADHNWIPEATRCYNWLYKKLRDVDNCYIVLYLY